MSPIHAKVTAIEKRGVQYQVVVEIVPKYRGSFNTLVLERLSRTAVLLRMARLNLVYYQNPGLKIGDLFPLWTLH
jgi:hypothetical protein